jgi:hypothetical protein
MQSLHKTQMLIEPIHETLPPVVSYCKYIKDLTGKHHRVVAIPEGTAAYSMGYRFVSVPIGELADYIAGGAFEVYIESDEAIESNKDSMRFGGAW